MKESKLIIVNDTGIKSITLIIILFLLTIGGILACVFNIINKIPKTFLKLSIFGTNIISSNPIVVSIASVFFLLYFVLILKKSIFSLRKITVDFDSRTVEIKGLSILIFKERIPFDEIKSLAFFEKENYEIKNGEHCWENSIKITGISDEVLFNEYTSNIINYDKLEKICGNLFKIDYRILKCEEKEL